MSTKNYYKIVLADGYETDVLDFLMALNLPPALTLAVKHFCRCGRKPGEPLASDLQKGIDYATRYLDVVISEAALEVTADAILDRVESGELTEAAYGQLMRSRQRAANRGR